MRVKLPAPNLEGGVGLVQALCQRSSCRDFRSNAPMDMNALAQLLWAAQGMSHSSHRHPSHIRRTSPSAGALYPLDLYCVVGSVPNVSPGCYLYDPQTHELVLQREGELRGDLSHQALDQDWMEDAAVIMIVAGEYERCTVKYRERGVRYTDIEVGGLCQNMALQGLGLGYGSCVVGAFHDSNVAKHMHLRPNSVPLALMPFGVPLK